MKPFVEGGGESLTRLPSPDLHKTAGLRAGSLSLHRSTPDGPSEYRPPPALATWSDHRSFGRNAKQVFLSTSWRRGFDLAYRRRSLKPSTPERMESSVSMVSGRL